MGIGITIRIGRRRIVAEVGEGDGILMEDDSGALELEETTDDLEREDI